MHAKTALAIAGSALAVPSAALAAAHDSAVPGHDALRASGHVTRDADAVRRLHARKQRPRRSRRTQRSTASAPLQAIAACA
jgi:hypothetical protein